MYERFTDKARKVLQLANHEAEQRHQDWLDTEHILLAIVSNGSGVATEVLKSLGIDILQVRDLILPKLASRSIGVPAGGRRKQLPPNGRSNSRLTSRSTSIISTSAPSTFYWDWCARRRASPPMSWRDLGS